MTKLHFYYSIVSCSSAPNASFTSQSLKWAHGELNSELQPIYSFPNCSTTSLKFASELLCLWIKKGCDEGSYEIISDSLFRYPAALEFCSVGCEMPLLQCRIGTTGCQEPSPSTSQSPFSLLPLFLMGKQLLRCFLWLQPTEKFLGARSIWEWGNAACCVRWGEQDVFCHRDWPWCSETFLHSKDRQTDFRGPSSPGLLLKAPAMDIHPQTGN